VIDHNVTSYLSAGDHDVVLTSFTARGVIRADVMLDAPLARILAVGAPCAAVHTNTSARSALTTMTYEEKYVRCLCDVT